jgi:DUF971 family protein
MKKFILLIPILCLGLISTYSQVEMIKNGTFEAPLTESDGYGSYSGSTIVTTLDNFRVDSVAFQGKYSVRIFDHTWGIFLWNAVPGYSDNSNYTVTFWYKGEEPMKFSMFIGRDLKYDLGADPQKIVPGNAVVAKDGTVENAKIVWTLPKKATWTKFIYTFKMGDWLGNDPVTGNPLTASCVFMLENTSYAKDDGASSYIDNISILKKDANELFRNGTFESQLTYPDGYGHYSGSTFVKVLDDLRVDSVAYEGNYSVKIFDHTWGTFMWNSTAGFVDNTNYTVSFWYKGEEPLKFSLFLGRDLKYDLSTDPDKLVPADAVVAKDGAVENAKVVWTLPKTAAWTQFTYTFKMSSWLGNDPVTGEPVSAACVLMFENTSYVKDDGASSYIDNVSVLKKSIASSVPVQEYQNRIKVFPNPSSDYLCLNGLVNDASLVIYNSTGQVIDHLRFNGQPLNIAAYKNGVYYIRSRNSDGSSFTGKFIKN